MLWRKYGSVFSQTEHGKLRKKYTKKMLSTTLLDVFVNTYVTEDIIKIFKTPTYDGP